MQDLTGKVALITGGTMGIGYSVAEYMIKAGMKVAITSRSEERALKAAEKLNKIKSEHCLGLAADVKSIDDQIAAVALCLQHFGQLDVLIANAGVGHFANIADLTVEQWNDTIDTNLTGVFYSVKASLEALQKSKGYIITIASLAGTNFFASGTAYNASKFGLVGFTQAMMLDVRNMGIKTSTIMPGSVSTHFNNRQPSAADNWKIQPEDIAQITMDLLHMHPRTLPSKVEVRPSQPPVK